MSLTELITLRRQRAELDNQIKSLEDTALAEALDLAASAGKQTFEHEGIKVQIRFKNRIPKPSEDPRLEELDHRIKAEIEAIRIRNREAIEAQQATLEATKAALDALTTSDIAQQYQADYDALAAELTTKDPQLALSL